MKKELNSAASEYNTPLWKSSECFSKPPTLVFLLKFPENPPPCCICLYFIYHIKEEFSLTSRFPSSPDVPKELVGSVPLVLVAGKHRWC